MQNKAKASPCTIWAERNGSVGTAVGLNTLVKPKVTGSNPGVPHNDCTQWRNMTKGPADPAMRGVGASDGRIFRNLLYLYRKTVNISPNLAFGRREIRLLYKKLQGAPKRL